MKIYEKNLKTLLKLWQNENDCLLASNLPLSKNDLDFLNAKELIKLKPAGDNQFNVIVQPQGLTYFEDKKQRRNQYIADHIFRFTGGFVSGVLTTVLATWIIQSML